MTSRKDPLMDTQTAAVDGRISDLRRLSAELHLERDAARARPLRRSGLRIALGRRLVSIGTVLLGELDGGAPVAARR
jgi:anti-sigma factor RsiW